MERLLAHRVSLHLVFDTSQSALLFRFALKHFSIELPLPIIWLIYASYPKGHLPGEPRWYHRSLSASLCGCRSWLGWVWSRGSWSSPAESASDSSSRSSLVLGWAAFVQWLRCYHVALPSTWMAVGVALVTLYGPSLLVSFHFLLNTLRYTWSPCSTPLDGSSYNSETLFLLLELQTYVQQLDVQTYFTEFYF